MFTWLRKRTAHSGSRHPEQQTVPPLYDRTECEAFISELAGADTGEIGKVLDMYEEHLMHAGVVDAGTHQFVYCPAGTLARERSPDPQRVAADAPRLAGVARATAAEILDAEFAYLQKCGLV